jgi:transcriptional regulator with XRE-family HTH domain
MRAEEVDIVTLLKQARINAGLEQIELAIKSNLTVRSLQRYESGKRKPNVETAQRLAAALGATVPDLFPLPKADKPRGGTRKRDKLD